MLLKTSNLIFIYLLGLSVAFASSRVNTNENGRPNSISNFNITRVAQGQSEHEAASDSKTGRQEWKIALSLNRIISKEIPFYVIL